MTDMPDRIFAWLEEDEHRDHVVITKHWINNLKARTGEETEYIRADLVAELVEAAQVCVDAFRSSEHFGLAAALAKVKGQQA